MQTFILTWAPEGRRIGEIRARDASTAKRRAPAPYRKFPGEIIAETVLGHALTVSKHDANGNARGLSDRIAYLSGYLQRDCPEVAMLLSDLCTDERERRHAKDAA